MNALDYLIQEHESHRKLLNEIESNHDVYAQFRKELIHHVNMEECILYPNLLRVPDLESATREAWEEHNLIMQLVQELDEQLDPKVWDSKFQTLKKLLLLHLDEEEKNLFPKIRSLSSDEFLDDVGEQMMIQKQVMPTEQIIYPDQEQKGPEDRAL